MAGCGVFGPTVKNAPPKETDIVKGTPTSPKNDIDTVEFVENAEEEFPPITDRTIESKTEHKAIYNVVLLAPFSAAKMQQESDRPNARMVRMIEFLAGFQYGLKTSIDEVNVNLQVIDTDDDPSIKDNIEKIPAIRDADIIIGPYFTDLVESISSYAFDHQKVVISPWNTSELTQANPYYIQLRPSLQTHAKKIRDFVNATASPDEIMLITKNDPRDIETLNFFRDLIIDSPLNVKRNRALIVQDIGDPGLTDSLVHYIAEQGYRHFIIPVWQDEPFVIAALSKLNFAKGEEHITVYGLPQWMEMSRMDYDYFENLDVHVSSARPVRYASEEAKALRNSFFQQYGDIPGDEAYYGLNLCRWLTHLLLTQGTDIRPALSTEVPVLDQDFQLTAVFSEDGESVHHYENQFIHILRFFEYKFEEVD
jgi:hypothetical protein